jgi:transposase InsO family protein
MERLLPVKKNDLVIRNVPVCKDFRKELDAHGFIQSMSRKGDCWDNERIARSDSSHGLGYLYIASEEFVDH